MQVSAPIPFNILVLKHMRILKYNSITWLIKLETSKFVWMYAAGSEQDPNYQLKNKNIAST